MTNEIFVTILIAVISNMIIIGAGYATLRERIKTNEIHTLYIRNAIRRLTKDVRDIMRSMNLIPRMEDETEPENER